MKIGRVTEAQALGEQAISLNENDARLQSILGDIYMAESDYESAEKSYADSIQIESEQPSTLKSFARSLEAQGKNVEALDAIQKARDAFPDDEQLLKVCFDKSERAENSRCEQGHQRTHRQRQK